MSKTMGELMLEAAITEATWAWWMLRLRTLAYAAAIVYFVAATVGMMR